MAGKGIGLYPNIKEAVNTLAKIEKTFLPDEKNREVYDKAYKNWKAAYPPLLRLSDENITKYMWCSP
jgi:autoinducer 2 (AI-2) kinase